MFFARNAANYFSLTLSVPYFTSPVVRIFNFLHNQKIIHLVVTAQTRKLGISKGHLQ